MSAGAPVSYAHRDTTGGDAMNRGNRYEAPVARPRKLRPGLMHIAIALTVGVVLSGCDGSPIQTQSIQRGMRGNGQVQLYNPRVYAAKFDELEIPDPAPPADADGPRAKEAFQNVQVLGDLSATQMIRVMTSMAAWVTGGEGCVYCHNLENPASDEKYTKVVARRMLQMTRYINSHWGKHVGSTGVVCYTCHRGNPVPENLWFENPGSTPASGGFLAWHESQNAPHPSIGTSALPADPFTLYLKGDNNIRVQATEALPQNGLGASVQQAEWTYSLMMTISKSLGVNCNYCHNTRALELWDQSSPPRATAWYGIRMVRSLNNNYEDSIATTLPENRHGPAGDGPKIYCATCHAGVFKPLYGISMLKDFPELKGDPGQLDDYLKWKTPMRPPTAAEVPAGAGALSANIEGKPGVRVYFASGQTELAPDFGVKVQDLIAYLKANPDAKVAVSGFNDPTGDAATNAQLAKTRAVAVSSALISAGIAEKRIVLQKPADTNGDGSNAEARRVEAKVI
jgi:photosynthetic reaction center cytochrome c subunit